MEKRNMTTHTFDYLKQAVCSASPNHGLTLVEIQRWEDDGGAILAEPMARREAIDLHLHDEIAELAAAE
jgi:hypothetical protein